MSKGKVWLVGAGPGDASLITVKGLHCIRHAEVLVHDRLVNPELIACAPADCRIINVGKTPNHHPVPQEEINAILVKYAAEGKNVVRLKGGDPYVFGRGGEEAESWRRTASILKLSPASVLLSADWHMQAFRSLTAITHQASMWLPDICVRGMSRRTGMHWLPLTAHWLS